MKKQRLIKHPNTELWRVRFRGHLPGGKRKLAILLDIKNYEFYVTVPLGTDPEAFKRGVEKYYEGDIYIVDDIDIKVIKNVYKLR